MSDQYADSGGYKPLLLPEKAEDLLEGRQYALTPLARLILDEVYGLRGVPTIVECLHRKIAKTRVTTRTENLETGEIKEGITILSEQKATFKAFLGFKRVVKFELDLIKMGELAPYYNSSHRLPALEEDWFENTSQQPLSHKLRGQPLRWWVRGAPIGGKLRVGRKAESLDLSILD